LIVENMEMTKMAETHVELNQFPVPRVGPRHSTVYYRPTLQTLLFGLCIVGIVSLCSKLSTFY